MNSRGPSRRSTRRHGLDGSCAKPVLNVDLNDPPLVVENRQSEITSVAMHSRASRRTTSPANLQHEQPIMGRQVRAPPPVDGVSSSPIDVEAIEEEVEFLSSSRGFPQVCPARIQPRRNRPMVIDEESGHLRRSEDTAVENPRTTSRRDSCTKRQRIPSNKTVIDCEGSSSEDNQSAKRKKVMGSCPEPQKAVPKEPTFTCPICMSTLAEASSTVCGHIFCQKCIKYAIQVQKKCPTCRRKLTMSNFHRVYLPTTD